MGLIEYFLPERLPRQVVYAGESHAEVITLARGRVSKRRRLEGAALAEGRERDWDAVLDELQPQETGVIFGASPFIFNLFDFDKLPWQTKACNELVSWRLQKIFPGDLAAYDHRFYRLDRRRVFSILSPRVLRESIEARFRERRVLLTYMGSSTMTLLMRMRTAKPAPDFFIESDGTACTMLFRNRYALQYVRKFRGSSPADTVEEAVRTVGFVREQYGIEPRRYWLVAHSDGAAALESRLAALAPSAGPAFTRLQAGLGETPYIPGSQ